MNHPSLEQGKRAKMKVFTVNPNQDVPIETLNSLLDTALLLYSNGTVKLK